MYQKLVYGQNKFNAVITKNNYVSSITIGQVIAKLFI